MSGKSVEKVVVTAIGKIEGKTQVWIAAVFNDIKSAKPWVALLNLAHKAGDKDTIKAMDIHAPGIADDKMPTGVKYSAAVTQYSPEAPALSDDTTMG